MKKDIIVAGVGGQGVLSIATVIGAAAMQQRLCLKQSEVHGMSQRGGEVQSNLRLSLEPIFSDIIPRGRADMIISLEPMEALRCLPWLAPDGWIITNSVPVKNISNYPPIEQVLGELERLPRVIALNVDDLAKETGTPRSANMVLLGVSATILDLLEPDKLRDGIQFIFGCKNKSIVEANLKAFDAGIVSAVKCIK